MRWIGFEFVARAQQHCAGKHGDGFIHRILFAYPDAASTGAWTEATITDEAEQAWCAAYNALAALAPESDGRPKIVRFTEGSRKVWAEWFTLHNAEIAQPDFPESLRGAWGKCRSYFPRFALTLQMLHCACGEADSEDVDERSARGAVALVDYFKSHAVRAYKRLRVTPGDKRATAAERANYEIMPMGIHWPDIDEDLSVAGVLKGQRAR